MADSNAGILSAEFHCLLHKVCTVDCRQTTVLGRSERGTDSKQNGLSILRGNPCCVILSLKCMVEQMQSCATSIKLARASPVQLTGSQSRAGLKKVKPICD